LPQRCSQPGECVTLLAGDAAVHSGAPNIFERLTNPRKDPIFSVAAAFREDPRPDKIDLSVGVYRNSEGMTPLMAAVRKAEIELANIQTSKSYLGLAGNRSFNQAMIDFVLGGTALHARAVAIQTPGASGALRVLADLVKQVRPDATIWISSPTYAYHRPVFEAAHLKIQEYPYFVPETHLVDEDAMLAQVEKLGKGDVLLLHGCCHNPTGADISLDTWARIAELANVNGFLPFVDMAYQGFGDGLDEDAEGMHILENRVEGMIIATSCSKNFGLYRERTGAAILIGPTKEKSMNGEQRLLDMLVSTYIMPPDHGAAIVDMILRNAALKAAWIAELDEMRIRIWTLRERLVDAFRMATGSDRLDYFARHKGMFSVTGLRSDQIERLRHDYGIYLVTDGRMNVAGLRESDVEAVAAAFVRVGA
jgi:aspartate aminotransferase